MQKWLVRALLAIGIAVSVANAIEKGTWALVLIGALVLALHEAGSWYERRQGDSKAHGSAPSEL